VFVFSPCTAAFAVSISRSSAALLSCTQQAAVWIRQQMSSTHATGCAPASEAWRLRMQNMLSMGVHVYDKEADECEWTRWQITRHRHNHNHA
jgi:hypothetical protein